MERLLHGGYRAAASAGTRSGQTPAPLYMVWVAALDGHGPVELLQEDEAAQFMGQGEAGQGQAFGGGGQGRRVQPQMAADEEGEGAGFQFPLGDPGGEFFRGKLAALGARAATKARGGI